MGAAIGAVVGGLSSIISQAIAGEDINWTAVAISAASGAVSGAINAAFPCMGAIATGVVEGTISAASYAATETLAYGRDVSFGDVLSVGLNNGIMAGCMKDIMQSIGLCNCFIAGTLVATETGYVTIENIKAGDLVWAHDPETGETALKPVVQTFRNETTEWIHVTVKGETLTCTPEHPFYVPKKGWTSAIDLRAGDILVMLNGEYVVVEQVQHELLESPETTYNFEVEDYHTYYVGEKSVLVHNRCDLTDAPATTHGDIRIGERGLTQREYDLLKASTNIKHQADGATVYIRQVTSNNHRVLVENTRGQIVTYIKDVTKHGLKNLARNYGWR